MNKKLIIYEEKKPHCKICHVDFESEKELVKYKQETYRAERAM